VIGITAEARRGIARLLSAQQGATGRAKIAALEKYNKWNRRRGTQIPL
jgi:hypothetical protein